MGAGLLDRMLLEIVIILILLIANGIFSGTEMAVVSARRGRLQQSAEQGDAGAAIALRLKENPNRFLSTVQIGITLIGTLTGVFGGASLTDHLTLLIAPLPTVGPYAETIALTTVVAVITYLSLVIGELVPKRLALQSAEQFASIMARPMAFIEAMTRPIIMLLTWSTNLLLVMLGRGNIPEEKVTEEDIRQLVNEGTEGGAVEPQEQALIESVFDFGDRTVRNIMTPRVDVYDLNADVELGVVLDDLLASGFSRFPVYEESTDHIVGIAHVRDLLLLYRSEGVKAKVRAAMAQPFFIPENSRAVSLLTIFRKSQRHLAIVVSELGGVEGIVTLEDVLEEIVGEIADEYDEAESQAIVRREDGSFLIDGMLPIDRAKDQLGVTALPDEDLYRFDTLAGFVLSRLGQIPRPGDAVVWGGWRFEVMDMDKLRIDKVLVSREESSKVGT